MFFFPFDQFFLTSRHIPPAYLRERTGPKFLLSSEESQNGSCTFTQLGIKGDSPLLVKFQTGERAQNSDSEGILGRHFLQGGEVISLQLGSL